MAIGDLAVGAGQGAVGGAAGGPWGALIGAGLGAAGSLFGSKKAKAPNYQPLIDMLNQSAGRQRGIATGLNPKLAPLNSTFSTDRSNLGTNYVSQAGDASGALANAEAEAGRARTLRGVPELQQNAREALAASGINRGGALLNANAKINQTAGEQLGNLNTEVGLQNLASKQEALKTKLGLDQNTMDTLYANGRGDLIDEANRLLGIEQGTNNAIAGVTGNQIEGQYAANTANDNRTNDLISLLTGAAGNVAGRYLSKPKAPAGPSAATQNSILADLLNRR